MRLACVYLPERPLQAVLRRLPEARASAVALLSDAAEAGRRARVISMTDAARRGGVRLGMTAAQASAACPGVTHAVASAADLEAADAALADVGYGFAARTQAEPGYLFFDVGDLGQLYPTEAAVAQAIQARAAHVSLDVRVAIAGTKGVGRAAARAHALAVVPPGAAAAAAFLAPLPVRLLDDPGAETALSLERWGVRTVGALAALPAADVALRLGPAGARLCRLAAGRDDELFAPRSPPDALEEAVDLEWPLYEIEPLAFVLRGLVDRALARLGCRSLACAGLTLRLALEPRGLDVREVPLAAPTRETAPLLQLVRLDLARRPPAAPVVGVRIAMSPARVRTTQLDFLRPPGPAPDRLAATVARLAALVGPDNVGAPRAPDTWREEAVAVAPYLAAPAGDAAARPAGGTREALTIRRFRPPEEIEVLIGREGPTALHGKDLTARVLVAAGPYRLDGEWWRRDDTGEEPDGGSETAVTSTGGFSRDYWDVHASDGAVYRLHLDRMSGRWFLDGYYD